MCSLPWLTSSWNVLDHPGASPKEPNQSGHTSMSSRFPFKHVEGQVWGSSLYNRLPYFRQSRHLQSSIVLWNHPLKGFQQVKTMPADALLCLELEFAISGVKEEHYQRDLYLPLCLWQDRGLVSYMVALGRFHYLLPPGRF